MDSFVVKKGTRLYRGTKVSNHPPFNDNIMWFAFSHDDASNYGNFIIEYEITKDVTLLNPMDTCFQNDYQTKVNKIFQGTNDNGFDMKKFEALVPFGLPSYEVQRMFLELQKVQIPKNIVWSTKHEMAVGCINGKHRYSRYERDQYASYVLSRLYPTHNGYMTNIMWPSKWHDGFFNKEVCIFNPKDCVKFVNSYEIKKGGGVSKKSKFIAKPKGDSWNRMDDPRLFDPNETKRIEDKIKRGGLSDYAKQVFGFD